MWAVGTASVLLALALCEAEETPLKWSKPASERTSNDWVPLSADQLGQASARSLGPPAQQNHIVHGIFPPENSNSFAQTFQQPPQFRPENGHRPQNKFLQPHVLSQQFLPPQVPPHLLAQQIPPQFLNQQFESNFNQFAHNAPQFGPQFVRPQEFGQAPPLRNERPQQHSVEDYLTEQKLPSQTLQGGVNQQENSFAPPRVNHGPTQKPVVDTLPLKKNPQEEKEQVQILYVPVETLKNRGRVLGPSKGAVYNQPIPQSNPSHQASLPEPIHQSQPSLPKESKKFRHPIQPLKDQTPAKNLPTYNTDVVNSPKAKSVEKPVQQEYDSIKDTSQQQITTSQFQHGQETKFVQPTQTVYEHRYPTEEPVFDQTNFRQYQAEKEFFTERPKFEYESYNRFSEIPSKPVPSETFDHRPTEYYNDEVQSTTKLPPPNQPPLSVYMETSPNSKVGDVLSLLKDAKTIPVLDTIGPDSPQVFVGPSNLKPPHGYVKFELPYLSSLDGNRVERKVLQLPFFVAPLNFHPPPGYSKIPFPPPHIGSVVLSNNTGKAVTEKYATTPIPHYSPSSTYRDPYTIPADISSISPQLPSLINSLQEEQYGPTTASSASPSEAYTEIPTETTSIPTTSTSRRPSNSRRNNFRGSQKSQYSSNPSTTPSVSSETRRPYGHRQRRPYNGRTQPRLNSVTTTTTTTTTTEESPSSIYDQSFIRDDQEYKDQQTTPNHRSNHFVLSATPSTARSADDSTPEYPIEPTYEQSDNRKFESDSKNKNIDRHYPTQDFVPQYNSDYYQVENAETEEKKATTPSRHSPIPSFDPEENYKTALPDTYYRSQPPSDNRQTFYSSFDAQFPASSINHEHNRQAVKSHTKEIEKPAKRPVLDEPTTDRQQYKETSDVLPFNAYDDSPPLSIGQLPPEYPVQDFRPEPKQPHFQSETVHKGQDSPSYEKEYTPSYQSDYTTQRAYHQPSQSDYKDYPSPVFHRHNVDSTPAITDAPQQERETYKPQVVSYSSEEETSHKHKLRGRPSHEHKTHDEYTTRSTTETHLETTTRAQTERPTQTRSRGRVRGRPLYTRPKTTAEPPNYPSNFAENKEQTPTESYKVESKVNTDLYSSTISDYTQHTTQPPPPPEPTTRTVHRKFSNQRTVHRRPLRPTSTPTPSTSTTSAPSGGKYLIRTRRPVSTPQTKLNTGRSRIRRPTTAGTTTTTESAPTETERWTVPQLPNISYRDEDALPIKGNQYQSFSRSPAPDNSDDKYVPYQTTPIVSPEVISSSRFAERSKSQEVSYDDAPILHTTRKHKPAQVTYDEGVEYQPDFQENVREPVRTVSFKPREPQQVTEIYDRAEEQSGNDDHAKKTHHKHRESYAPKEEREERKKIRAKHRGSQPSVHYEEESYETTRRPVLKHREHQHTTPTYSDRTQDKDSSHLSSFSSDEPSIQTPKHYVSTPKTHSYRERDQEAESEDKYIPERNPALIPDSTPSNEKYKPKSAQKEAEDFWNQAVTIQQSKSYVYNPDGPAHSDSAVKTKSKPRNEQQFSEYDDYFGFQEPDKASTSDQAPFPSNDQQVTYTGVKPDVNVGKANQYSTKDENKEFEKPANVDEAQAVAVEGPFSSNERSSTVETSSQEAPAEDIPSSSTKKPGRRRGTWVRVRVKKPKDVFETAESQRFGSLSSNALSSNSNDKTKDKKWEVDNNEKGVESTETPSLSTTNQTSPSVMEQFQITLTSMIANYMNKGEEKKDNGTAEEVISTTTDGIDLTTIQTSTEEQAYTTPQSPTSINEELVQTTTDAPSTSEYAQTAVPTKVLGTSTTTEISLETEICYKGRCVKTKRAKDRVKDESDLMTIE